MNHTEPLVSISCITYNHAPYIRRALSGFLSQKTNFPFEILIHDDASTDETQEIIREYEEKYPDIIKPIYRTENQYSKGIRNISGAFNFPRARGKYIAMCEGDDYWCDDGKLQLQADYMEAHPECTMCFHAAKVITESEAFVRKEMRPYRGDRSLSAAEVIDTPCNYPTASLFFRTELATKLPDWYHKCPIGDVPIHIFMAAHGSVYYFDRQMSVYRLGVATSWTTEMDKGDRETVRKRYEAHLSDLRKMYEGFNRDTEDKYRAQTEAALKRKAFLVELNARNLSVLKDPENRSFVRELPQPQRFLLKLEAAHPGLYHFIRTCYYKGKRG